MTFLNRVDDPFITALLDPILFSMATVLWRSELHMFTALREQDLVLPDLQARSV